MSVNQSARFCELLLGDFDYSDCLMAVQVQDTHLDESGLIFTSGQITLKAPQAFPESLDDRKNVRLDRGQIIYLSVAGSAGVMKRHPRGALRILEAEYDEENQVQTLQVGCHLSLLNSTDDDTDPDDSGIVPGVMTPRSDIVNGFLSKLQISGTTTGVPYPINYPIEIGNSYLETIGHLLYAAGYLGWIDRNETFRVKPVNLRPTSAFQMQLALMGDRLIWYRRLSNPESPKKVISAVGVTKLVKPAQPPQDALGIWVYDEPEERIGPAKAIHESLSGNAVLSRVESRHRWKDANIHESEVTQSKPLGLLLPEKESNRAAVVVAEQRTERRYYEPTQKAKLLKIEIEVWRIAGQVLDEYLKVLEEEGTIFVGETLPIQAEITLTTYTFDCKERIKEITETKSETIASALKGTNQDWAVFSGTPIKLTETERTTKSWNPEGKSGWVYVEELDQVYARAFPEALTPETSTGTKLAVVGVSRTPNRSNSGQVNPPAADHKPAAHDFYDRQIKGEAQFSSVRDSRYREQSRTYEVPYLAGLEGDIQNHCGQDDVSLAQQQLEAIAEQKGTILLGRSKGQEIAMTLDDYLLDHWEPLMSCDVVESDGTTRVYLLDASNWVLGPLEAYVNFDGIWMGDRISAPLPPRADDPTPVEFVIKPLYQPTLLCKIAGVSSAVAGIKFYSLDPVGFTTTIASAAASRSVLDFVITAHVRVASASSAQAGFSLIFNGAASSVGSAARSVLSIGYVAKVASASASRAYLSIGYLAQTASASAAYAILDPRITITSQVASASAVQASLDFEVTLSTQVASASAVQASFSIPLNWEFLSEDEWQNISASEWESLS